uniref:Interferon-related developmental regulator 1 n=1 Tax=Parasteatoda tepidariorum TaxID=114398 RepID=A0A2L2YRL3_PARTP
MPKGKKKNKFVGRQKQDSNFASEEESVADTASVVSIVSELRLDSDDDTITEVDEENVLIDNFEDKLK